MFSGNDNLIAQVIKQQAIVRAAAVVGLGLSIVLVDQLTKFWAQSQGLVVINRGVALGLAGEYIHIKTLMIVAGLILAWMSGRAIWQRLPVATGLFWGGAAANLIDRYWFAGVRDWIPVPMLALKNNLADWSIGVGLVIILTVLLKRSPRGSE